MKLTTIRETLQAPKKFITKVKKYKQMKIDRKTVRRKYIK